MSLDGVYDENNIFARILRGEVPSTRIFEDSATLGFMDAFPQAEGHCLVIHKTSRARNLLDVEPAALEAVMEATRRLAIAVSKTLKPDGIMISQFNGSAAGQTVFHLHVHIIPRWQAAPLGRHGGGMADPVALQALAQRIAEGLRA